ncbi:MAG: hypothetical protein AAF152_07375 [Cyanobacteria bacterium P01_A01_bin.114]
MTQLVPVKLEDGSEIYIEASDNVQISSSGPAAPAEQVRGGQKGIFGNGSRGVTHYPGGLDSSVPSSGSAIVAQNFKALESTIKTYTNQTLNAFKELARSTSQGMPEPETCQIEQCFRGQ